MLHARMMVPSTSRRRKFVATTTMFAIVSSLLIAIAAAPASAAPAPAPYANGFENASDVDFATFPNEAMSSVTRVASGTGGITSASGGWHASAAMSAGSFTRYGGYSSVFPSGGYTTSVDIYLDMTVSPPSSDIRFDWSSAISTPAGGHRRDFIFSVGTNGSGGFVMSASNNSPGWPANPARDPFTITSTGWYTFQHTFKDNGSGVLAVDMSVLDSSDNVLKTWTLSDPTDVIGGTVGGNRYGWLVVNGFLSLALDNLTRSGVVQCTSVCYVDDDGSNANGGTSIADAKETIQAAINQVEANGQVRVLPGNYDETAAGSAPTSLGGTYQFGLFFGSAKPGITLMGVDGTDNPITDPTATQATITTNATNNFGYSGIFVEAANTTIQGVEIGPNTPGDNKTVEVVADNFTLKDVDTSIPAGGGSIYINDFSAGGTVVQSYHVLENRFDDGTSVDISSGAGNTGPVSGREILDNTFDLNDNGFNGVSFNGSGGVAWFVNPVGGAIITGNDFSNSTQYIRARGVYDNSQFDWESYWNDNTYDRAAVALVTESPFDVRSYAYSSFTNVRRIGGTIQGEVDHTVAGDTVLVKKGTYAEHVTLDRDITVKGANAGIAGNDARGAESRITGANSGAVQITADGVTLDGFEISSASNDFGAGIHMSAAAAGALIENNVITGNQIGIYANSDGPSTITQNLFDANNEPGSSGGSGIYSEFTDGLTVDDNEFKNHTTNTPMIFAATGAGVHTDLKVSNNYVHDNVSGVFAVGVNGGEFTGNDISAAGGTALGFSGGNTDIQVTKNLLHDSARGVRVQDFAYGLGDDSDIHVNRNSITNNTAFAVGNVSGYTGTLDAECNWYGAADGPTNASNPGGTGDVVQGDVAFAPWLLSSDLDGNCALNNAPTVDAGGPYTVNEGSSVAISGTANDGDGDTVTTQWTISPIDSNCTIDDPTALSTTVSCDDGPGGGTYTLTLTATDDGVPSEQDSDTATLTVSNVAPTVTSLTPDSSIVMVGQSVTWTATATDPSTADTNAGFTYEFNGGGYQSTNTKKVTYTTCGTFTMTVTAKDKDGGVSAPFTSATSVQTFNYQVLPPLEGAAENQVKRGQVVPVQIKVLGCNGLPVPNLTPEIRLLKGDKTSVDENNDNTVTGSVSGADSGTTMRSADSKYMYNLRIPNDVIVNGEYTIRIRPFAPGNPGAIIDIALRIRK